MKSDLLVQKIYGHVFFLSSTFHLPCSVLASSIFRFTRGESKRDFVTTVVTLQNVIGSISLINQSYFHAQGTEV